MLFPLLQFKSLLALCRRCLSSLRGIFSPFSHGVIGLTTCFRLLRSLHCILCKCSGFSCHFLCLANFSATFRDLCFKRGDPCFEFADSVNERVDLLLYVIFCCATKGNQK